MRRFRVFVLQLAAIGFCLAACPASAEKIWSHLSSKNSVKLESPLIGQISDVDARSVTSAALGCLRSAKEEVAAKPALVDMKASGRYLRLRFTLPIRSRFRRLPDVDFDEIWCPLDPNRNFVIRVDGRFRGYRPPGEWIWPSWNSFYDRVDRQVVGAPVVADLDCPRFKGCLRKSDWPELASYVLSFARHCNRELTESDATQDFIERREFLRVQLREPLRIRTGSELLRGSTIDEIVVPTHSDRHLAIMRVDGKYRTFEYAHSQKHRPYTRTQSLQQLQDRLEAFAAARFNLGEFPTAELNRAAVAGFGNTRTVTNSSLAVAAVLKLLKSSLKPISLDDQPWLEMKPANRKLTFEFKQPITLSARTGDEQYFNRVTIPLNSRTKVRGNVITELVKGAQTINRTLWSGWPMPEAAVLAHIAEGEARTYRRAHESMPRWSSRLNDKRAVYLRADLSRFPRFAGLNSVSNLIELRLSGDLADWHFERLPKIHHLRELAIGDLEITNAFLHGEGLRRLTNIASIDTLTIRHQRRIDEWLPAIAAHPKIERLEFEQMDLRALDLGALRKSGSLRSITLRWCRVSPTLVSQLFDGLAEEVLFKYCEWPKETIELAKDSPLTGLELSDEDLSESQLLRLVRRCPRLHSLEIRGDVGVELMKHLRQRNFLTQLRLYGPDITDSLVEPLTRLKLKELKLGGARIDAGETENLHQLARLDELSVDFRDFDQIGRLLRVPGLQTLRVRNNTAERDELWNYVAQAGMKDRFPILNHQGEIVYFRRERPPSPW